MKTILMLSQYVFQSGLEMILKRRTADWKKLPNPICGPIDERRP